MRIALALVLIAGCATDPWDAPADEPELATGSFDLSASAELTRVTAIRDVAGAAGLTNGALMAGIAESETNLAHCWSEATWACQGPPSASCGGGPVIAGSADGACELEQGGLGMFQFDAGTYADTLARDGESILLLEGNIDKAVDFVSDRAIEEIDGIYDTAAALDWMNQIKLRVGDPAMEEWSAMLACRYNGCCDDSALCQTRRDRYRDNAIAMQTKYGAAFWADAGDVDLCPAIPAEGRTIDDTDDCFVADGPARTWRGVTTGFGGSSLWTLATSSANAANVGIWNLELKTAGTYLIEVHLDGGVHAKSKRAAYEVVGAGKTTRVVLDQSSKPDGFAVLGQFDFTAGGGQYVRLADNTGEPRTAGVQILYDAIRVSRGGKGKGDDLGDDGDVSAGCATGGPAGFGSALFLAALLIRRRKRSA